MPKHEELTGTISRINQVFGEPPNETVIARLEDGTIVKGKASPDELIYEFAYLFRGWWTTHPRWGKQFQFFSFGIAQPVGQRGTVAYLQRGPGIGRQRAMAIWSIYGQGSLEAIRTKPDEVAAAVTGLTATKAREAAAYFQSHIDREIVTRDLEEIGLTGKLIDWAIEKWGARAAQLIRENPWRLMVAKGYGFGRADKLYLSLGGDPTNPERLGWCAQHALVSDREGSTWSQPRIAEMAIAKSVSGVEVKPGLGVAWAVEKGIVVEKVDEAGQRWIAEEGRAAAEARLASHVWRAMAEGAV